ncbi:defensin-like peptide family protein [Acinetobacter baumannii 532279]|nr:defensin-like peptide family protein [Acinetobacter baumannii 532279]
MSAIAFLNGVCRHEQEYDSADESKLFLNGVCRHELIYC